MAEHGIFLPQLSIVNIRIFKNFRKLTDKEIIIFFTGWAWALLFLADPAKMPIFKS